jgi:hypothetical protein
MKSDTRETPVSQWSEKDRNFESLRNKLLNDVDLKKYVDDPFLFTSRQRVTDFLSRIELYKKIINIKGSIVECGVHRGGSLMLYAHLCSILEPYSFNRKIIGFDTFEGFAGITAYDQSQITEDIFSDTSQSVLQHAINLHDCNRSVAHISKCELVKGNAVNTIPIYKKNNPHLIISLLYLDFDLYAPTKVALDELLPLVPKGGIIAFDELNSTHWKGETLALKKYFNDSLANLNLQKFYFDPWVSYYVVGE